MDLKKQEGPWIWHGCARIQPNHDLDQTHNLLTYNFWMPHRDRTGAQLCPSVSQVTSLPGARAAIAQESVSIADYMLRSMP